jgi:putative tryptophan/tyrosine transport system substrate-binding protein
MAIHIERRKFLTTLGGAAAWPLAARSQQPVIGFLGRSSPDRFAYLLAAFRQGLSETDFVEGRNVLIEYRWAEGRNDRLPGFAADLVRRQVSVIAASNTQGTLAAKATTSAITIVFAVGSDPIRDGLVASLNRPGGNITGIITQAVELGPKRLELLRELVPAASVIAVLVNPSNPVIAEPQLQALPAVARTLGVELRILNASTEREIHEAFAKLAELGVGALFIAADGVLTDHSELLAALALRHAVPAIFHYREFTAAGGLLSYGGSTTDQYRLAGIYTGRILKGEKPADLPVQAPTKYELVINLKTAKTLGITIPTTLLLRADEVIE